MTILFLPPTLVTGVSGVNTKGLRFTDMDTAFFWTTVLMIGNRCISDDVAPWHIPVPMTAR
jgi:Mg2+ and Co2+ transporter CorA